MRRTLARVRDFLSMGVPEVWVFDPESRTVQVCRPEGTTESLAGTLRIPGTQASISIEEAFSVPRRPSASAESVESESIPHRS